MSPAPCARLGKVHERTPFALKWLYICMNLATASGNKACYFNSGNAGNCFGDWVSQGPIAKIATKLTKGQKYTSDA